MTEAQSKIEVDTLLRRSEAARSLTAAGYPISLATLATMASRGGGPRFKRFGKTPLYRWGDLVQWAEERTTPFAHSVAECEAAREAAA